MMIPEEVMKILKKLDPADRKNLEQFIKNHLSENDRLKTNLAATAQLFSIIISNLQAIQVNLDNITRELARAGILRPRTET